MFSNVLQLCSTILNMITNTNKTLSCEVTFRLFFQNRMFSLVFIFTSQIGSYAIVRCTFCECQQTLGL